MNPIVQLITTLGPFGFGLLNISNPCVLPMYPGFLSYLAGNQAVMENRRLARWLGVISLAGLLTSMLLVGLILSVFQIATSNAFAILLPLGYLFMIGFGIMLLLRINPFERIPMIHSPRFKNPILTCFVYGMLYGPIALPCNAGAILAIFAFGVADVRSVLGGIGYFLLFGIGFGLPLLVLPFLADPVRKSLLNWMGRYHIQLMQAAGALLIVVAVLSFASEWDTLRSVYMPDQPPAATAAATPTP